MYKTFSEWCEERVDEQQSISQSPTDYNLGREIRKKYNIPNIPLPPETLKMLKKYYRKGQKQRQPTPMPMPLSRGVMMPGPLWPPKSKPVPFPDYGQGPVKPVPFPDYGTMQKLPHYPGQGFQVRNL